MLSDAFKSGPWPADHAAITVTPDGFVRAPLSDNHDCDRGWDPKRPNQRMLFKYAEATVMRGIVLRLAGERMRFLPLGVASRRDDTRKYGHPPQQAA